MILSALFNFVILVVVTGIHIYWGLGGNLGLQAAVPERNGTTIMRPGRIATLLVSIIFGCMALFYLYKIGWLSTANAFIPSWLNHYGLWVLAGIFLLRAIGDFRYVGFFKRVRNSRFAELDTRFYSPLCFLLSANSFLLIFFLSRS